MTVAERLSEQMGSDGGRTEGLDTLCREAGAVVSYARHDAEGGYVEESRGGIVELTRYVFADGSAIVETNGAWDVEGKAPFSWAGAA